MQFDDNFGFATKEIRAGYEKNKFGALATPIYQSSTFIFETAEQGGRRFALEEEGYIYTRLANPTNTVIENKLAVLEGGESAVCAASGMGAISSVMWSVLNAGDHLIAPKTMYGCTFSLFSHQLTRFNIEVSFVDFRDVNNVKDAMKDNTAMIYMESPANPNMYLADIKEISKIAHQNPNCLAVVDNTYCTPVIQRPLELGADIVIHSATKYLNGHGDVIAGFVVGKKDIIEQVRTVGIKDCTGACLSPFDAYLIGRGMKTLSIRMQKHCDNAMKVAEFLESHKAVEKIAYPGLKSFPQYELAQKQMKLPGAMISFEVKGGKEAGIKLMNSVKLCTLAVSLGDIGTLIQHPASMTHSPYTEEERKNSGISEGLVRLSVGLEDVEDIIADLKQALDILI